MTKLSKRRLKRLQAFVILCKIKLGLIGARRQGLAFNDTTLANNSTELASMDPVDIISKPFRFSFLENGHLWLFDIRALLTERNRVENAFNNPYTSLPVAAGTLLRLRIQVDWLRRRRYFLDAANEPQEEHKLLDLCYAIDSYGYLTNVNWFKFPSIAVLHRFVDTLDELWAHRLGLTNQQRFTIFPDWDSSHLVPLIRSNHLSSALHQLYTFLFVFIKAAANKEDRVLASVYVLMALTHVSQGANIAFPWLHNL